MNFNQEPLANHLPVYSGRSMSEIAVHFQRVRTNGVELSVVRAGEGPVVVLLHGFPENWTSWRLQIPVLVAAGYSVWIPDLRGYNLSDKPPGRDAYHLRHLTADIAGIVRATGQPRVSIVGHDWGGLVAWTFAGQYPELLSTLTILNAPHAKLYEREILRLRQLFKSWYVALFQLPWLPEQLLSFNNFALMRWMFRSSARPGTFSQDDIEAYVSPFRQPYALTAALNYYRANFRYGAARMAKDALSEAPTLVIWGERDPALSIHLLDGLEQVAANVEIKRLPDAGHWVQNEASDEVNATLVAFLQAARR
jgi:epoxide hydrolase 4